MANGHCLFPHRSDMNRPLNSIDRGHHKAVRGAGIEPAVRLYDFRHTFGSRSAMAGVDLATLKELMGGIRALPRQCARCIPHRSTSGEL